MKTALHCLLVAALLLQGALAVAMPIAAPAAASHASMPCHGGDHQKSLPCCAHQHCACEAICSAIALPMAIGGVAAVIPAPPSAAPRASLARPAFRLTPLRPPIALSA